MDEVGGRGLASLCGASTAIAVFVAGWAWARRKQVPAARPFAFLTAAEALWSLGHLFEVLAPTLSGKVFWDSLQYLPYGVLAPAALLTAMQYRGLRVSQFWIWGFGAITVLLAAALALFPWLAADRRSARLIGSPPALLYDLGALDYVLAFFSYAGFLTAAALVLMGSSQPGTQRRGDVALAMSLAIPPLFAGFAFGFGIRLFDDRDITPILFTVACLVSAWGLARRQLFQVMPVAVGLILERLPVGVIIFNDRMQIVEVNPEAAALTGMPAAKSVGRSADDALGFWAALRAILRQPAETIAEIPGANGHRNRWFGVVWTPLPDDEGHLAGGALLIRDVTMARQKRQDTEARLALSEDRFRALFDESFQIVALLDRNGTVLAANRAALAAFQTNTAEIVGTRLSETSWMKQANGGRGGDLIEGIAQAAAGGFVRMEADFRSEGAGGCFDISLKPIRDARGETTEILLEARDVTVLRQEQERSQSLALDLQRAQKNETLGRLAGGVAHDFNNILTVVQGNIELLRDHLDDDGLGGPLVEEVIEAARAGAEITRQLLVFSRQASSAPRIVELSEAVQPARALLRRLLGEDISIDESWPSSLWPVRADPSQLQQVVLNLAINARDAMPKGGRLSIRASNVQLEARRAAALGGRAGAFVCLEVADTGSGMTADVKARLFEPFFTTKTEGKGTGLGLVVVNDVVRQNGGFIEVRSDPGRGAQFRVFFPAEPDAIATEDVGRPRSRRAEARRTVVVVEDQQAVRHTIERALTRAGYVTHGFANPKALLLAAESFDPAPDLLLSDVVLPGMSGAGLADALVSVWPGLKVLFVSGYLPRGQGDVAGLSDEDETLLAKPFSLDELVARIDEAIRGAPAWAQTRRRALGLG